MATDYKFCCGGAEPKLVGKVSGGDALAAASLGAFPLYSWPPGRGRRRWG